MSQTDMQRRSFLRGTITLARARIALPGLFSLGGCAQAPASLAPMMPMIGAIADKVIPVTDTPGALAAGVPDYVAGVFAAHFTAEQQQEFVAGLSAIDAMAGENGSTSFAEAWPEAQDAVLAQLGQSGDDPEGGAVWKQLRDMVIFGFYTSESATAEMPYEALPGRYIGCLPLEEVGGAWLERGV